jgi:hypothetical protein
VVLEVADPQLNSETIMPSDFKFLLPPLRCGSLKDGAKDIVIRQNKPCQLCANVDFGIRDGWLSGLLPDPSSESVVLLQRPNQFPPQPVAILNPLNRGKWF